MKQSPLEINVIANARQDLAQVLAYYRARAAGELRDDEHRAYQCHYYSLHAVVGLAHQQRSGLSAAGIAALREIEATEAAAYLNNPLPESAVPQLPIRPFVPAWAQ